MVWPLDFQPSQQVGVNLVLRVLLAGIRYLINWHKQHQAHQPTDTMSPSVMAMTLHVTRHSLTGRVLRSNVPRGWREPYQGVFKNCLSLLGHASMPCQAADDLHELQILSALANRVIIKPGACQPLSVMQASPAGQWAAACTAAGRSAEGAVSRCASAFAPCLATEGPLQKIAFHHQLADLGMQFVYLNFAVLRRRSGALVKRPRHILASRACKHALPANGSSSVSSH